MEEETDTPTQRAKGTPVGKLQLLKEGVSFQFKVAPSETSLFLLFPLPLPSSMQWSRNTSPKRALAQTYTSLKSLSRRETDSSFKKKKEGGRDYVIVEVKTRLSTRYVLYNIVKVNIAGVVASIPKR